MMTTEDAVRYLRTQPEYAALIRDAYLGEDVFEAAERFRASAEFAEVRSLVGSLLPGGTALDLGAGTGIASFALATSGAKLVYALEPDPSDLIGTGAVLRLRERATSIELLATSGESIPLADGAVDLVYARQVLHHVQDLRQVLRECARILKPGGVFLACREHVVESAQELSEFLESHPVHRLAGGENAFSMSTYKAAIHASGLKLQRVFDHWDTVINAFPTARTRDELHDLPRAVLEKRLGRAGKIACRVPGIQPLVRMRIKQYKIPGRLVTFLARKP